MNLIQQLEAQEHDNAYYDRFAGFDRGDRNEDPNDDGFVVVGRMRDARGRKVEIVEAWFRSETTFAVFVDGELVDLHDTFEDARVAARKLLA